jgi:hypothetical protein
MLKRGIVVAALLVGCFAGVGVREIVFPARAAPGPAFSYKVVRTFDLIGTVKASNASFKDADARTALEEGLSGFGRAGWRYAGCLPSSTMGWGTNACDTLIFEAAGVDAPPPPARTNVTPPPPPPAPPPTMMHH